MNGFLMEDRWWRVRDRIMAKWSKFTRREVERMREDLDRLIAQMQESYGYERGHAEREYHEFLVGIRPMILPANVLGRKTWN